MDNIQNTIENMLIAGEIDQNEFFGNKNKNKDKNTNRANKQQNKSENTDDEE
jgi:hypothetical protein